MAFHSIGEAQTRYNLIDPQLKKAGWNLLDHTQVGLEIPVSGYDVTPLGGITDYCLYRPNGDVLGVVEAKRTSRDPWVGEQQVLEHVTAIEKKETFRPFALMAYGEDTFFRGSDTSAERRRFQWHGQVCRLSARVDRKARPGNWDSEGVGCPGGSGSRLYAMAVDHHDRTWFVDAGLEPNRLIGFNPGTEEFFSNTEIKRGVEQFDA